MKEYFEVKIEVRHVLIALLFLYIIYVFVTGWEYGFSGVNPNGIGPNIWQGLARVAVCGLVCIVSVGIIFTHLDEGFTLKLKNPFYFQDDVEDWKEYQQWLKERENNKY